jgi:hemerythrin-like metal-binding protein
MLQEVGERPVSLIIWRGDFSVGHPRLDADHIVIASLINHIDDAKQVGSDEQAVGTLLKVLLDNAYAHFEREEQLLERCNYPELARHREEHRLVEDQLDELYEAYTRTPDPALSREIMEVLHFWLVEHIMKTDMHYRRYVMELDH